MKDLYSRRFDELQGQMGKVLSTLSRGYSEMFESYIEDIDDKVLLEWVVKARSLLNKACGVDSEHYKEFLIREKITAYGKYVDVFGRLKAIFFAAKEDYQGGYLVSTRALVQSEVFDSELEQARELQESGYICAAAVVTGVVLETTLRELCDRKGLAHGKLDRMNSDLAKAGVYNKLQQKKITALTNIRNSAAHGKKQEFNDKDVVEMIRDVERFVVDNL